VPHRIKIKLLSLAFFVALGVAVAGALPQWPVMAASAVSKESSAIRHLVVLKDAKLKFKATTGKGHFGTMSELKEENLIDAELAGGFKDGYCFVLQTTDAEFEVTAVPARYPSDGRRSFYFSLEDAIIRAADKEGRAADANDPPLPEAERVAASTPN
jgi:hypothetical protein